jgi:hypothetical protein
LNHTLPAIVFPYHDLDGSQYPIIVSITPALKKIFDCAILSVSGMTIEKQSQGVQRLQDDSFFRLSFAPPGAPIGEQFLVAYRHAANICQPEQILHLCFHDRVAFTLNSRFKNQFIADIRAIEPTDCPLLFQRSASAWLTHPRNYFETEQMVTRVGEMLTGKTLDWTWCHLAITARQLAGILRRVTHPALSVLSEMLYWLKDTVRTQDVDWLAWEDPYILNRDADDLRRERENSVIETCKRLSYVIPCIQYLYDATNHREANHV